MGQIAYFSMRLRKMALFLIPVKNLTSPSCTPTPTSYNARELWRFGHKYGQIAYFSLRMRETPIFLLPVKNLTLPSCSPTPITYKACEFRRYVNISGRYCVFHISMDFQDLWVKNEILGENRGRGGAILTPNELVLVLFLGLVKIDKEMRP